MAYNRLLCIAVAGLVAVPATADAATYTFCLRYPDERYYDASVRKPGTPCTSNADCDDVSGMTGTCVDVGLPNWECQYDFGEDRGRNTGNWSVRRINAYVYEASGGALKYSGHVNDNGCTTSFTSSSDKFNIYYGTHYRSTWTKFDFRVLDCTDDDLSTCSYPLYSVLGYDPGSSGTYYVVLDDEGWPLDAYMAAAYTVNRFLGGIYNSDSSYHDFDIWSTGWAAGDPIGYTNWDGSQPVVHLDSTTTRSKFTVSHELGHAFLFDIHGSYISPSTVDCSYGPGGSSGHTVYGLEYQSCANFEGYGHFVSAVTWNNLDNNAQGYFVTVANQYITGVARNDIEIGSKELFAHCDPALGECDGKATEMDWARTWWDFRTDGTSGHPTIKTTLDTWEDAAPWQVSTGHYIDILYNVPSGFQSRFDTDATYNGTDY